MDTTHPIRNKKAPAGTAPGQLAGESMPRHGQIQGGHHLPGWYSSSCLLLAGVPQVGPVNVGAQFFAAHSAIGGTLYRRAVFSRWHLVRVGAVQPLVDVRLNDLAFWRGNSAREGGLSAKKFDCPMEVLNAHCHSI